MNHETERHVVSGWPKLLKYSESAPIAYNSENLSGLEPVVNNELCDETVMNFAKSNNIVSLPGRGVKSFSPVVARRSNSILLPQRLWTKTPGVLRRGLNRFRCHSGSSGWLRCSRVEQRCICDRRRCRLFDGFPDNRTGRLGYWWRGR